MAVLGYPQGVATALTTLFERGQRFLVRRLGTRMSASHLLAPASKGQLYHLSLRLLSTQDCRSAFFPPVFPPDRPLKPPDVYEPNTWRVCAIKLGHVGLRGAFSRLASLVNWRCILSHLTSLCRTRSNEQDFSYNMARIYRKPARTTVRTRNAMIRARAKSTRASTGWKAARSGTSARMAAKTSAWMR